MSGKTGHGVSFQLSHLIADLSEVVLPNIEKEGRTNWMGSKGVWKMYVEKICIAPSGLGAVAGVWGWGEGKHKNEKETR